MPFGDIQADQRNAIHAEHGRACTYTDRATPPTPSAEQLAEGLSLSVRFKSKLRVGSAESDGLSIMENVESLIFNKPQLDALDLVLDHGGLIAVPQLGITFELDQEMDPDGPVNVYWTVVRA